MVARASSAIWVGLGPGGGVGDLFCMSGPPVDDVRRKENLGQVPSSLWGPTQVEGQSLIPAESDQFIFLNI